MARKQSSRKKNSSKKSSPSPKRVRKVPPVRPILIRLLLDIQDHGGSCEVPSREVNSSFRNHILDAVAAGFGVVDEAGGMFRLTKKVVSAAIHECGTRLHLTASGAHCPKCRNGITPMSRKEMSFLKRIGATWSESRMDVLSQERN